MHQVIQNSYQCFSLSKIKEVEKEISSITDLVTNTALTAVENKKPDHTQYMTTPKFKKLTTENFIARLKQANSATKGDTANFLKKTDFNDKLKQIK